MKGWRMVRGDYRFEGNPTRAFDDAPCVSSREHVQHVFTRNPVPGGHHIRRDSKGIVRCSYRTCVLNVGRVWKKGKRKGG